MNATSASAATIQGPVSSALWTIEAYEYPSAEPGSGADDQAPFTEPRIQPWEPAAEPTAMNAPASEEAAGESGEEPSSSPNEALLIEARQQGYEAGRRQGREEGRLAAEEQARAELAAHTQAADKQRQSDLACLAENFDAAREHYFHVIEPEVVRLALAIAARILRREAQMDPLLLTGAVRVALGQIASSSNVRIKVPPAELNLWREAIALLPKLTVRPEIVPGETMRLGDCVIETELGSVDLGVRSQLSEIERGFFDRAGTQQASEALA